MAEANRLMPALAAAVLAALLFGVTLRGTYVYDDVTVVRDDPRVRPPARWRQLWAGTYNDGPDNLYRPLVSTSYAAEWWLHGDRPWLFHLVNVLLHAAAAAAVAEVARRATGRAGAAWGAGLLFAAHPIHAEAVANIVGRAELAAALALLASVALLLRRPLTPARAAAVLACGAAAVLSKEQGLLAPALWVGVAVLVWRDRPVGGERAVAQTAAAVALWIWAGYMLVREHYLKFDWDRLLLERAMQPMVHTVGVQRLLLPVALLGRYAALIVWPAHLSPDYGGDVIGSATRAADPYLWVGVGVIVAWALAVGISRRRGAGFALFCLLALGASYVLIGNVVSIIGTIFGERLAYLPSAFLALPAGVAVARLPRWPRAIVLAAAVVPLSILTVRAAAEWNHPDRLFARALADHPGSIQLHLLVAEMDRERGRTAEQTRVLDDACRQFPDYWRPWAERGRVAADAGDFALAEADVQRAVDLAPNPDLLALRGWLSEREAAAGWHAPPSRARPSSNPAPAGR